MAITQSLRLINLAITKLTDTASMSLPNIERSINSRSKINKQTREQVKRLRPTQDQLLMLLQDINPPLGSLYASERSDPVYAQYLEDAGVLELAVSNQLADAIIFPDRLGSMLDKKVQPITHLPESPISDTRNGHTIHSPPRLAITG